MSVPITHLPQEQQIKDFLAEGKKEEGKRLLLQTITETARQRRFDDAERLREWLIEIDPMALNDIIRTAELIENEMRFALDKTHLDVWSDLSEALGPNEFLVLYHSLEHQRLAKGVVFVRQGSRHSALYFVNSGKVELFFQENGRDVVVRTIGPGVILGACSFFEASVWTINARSLGAEVSLLKLDKLEKRKKDFPGLESKLDEFCSRFTIVPASFIKTGRDRRTFERVRISGKVGMTLLDKNGKETGIRGKGDLFDISFGGISFFLHISNKKSARLLLGRKVGFTIASTLTSRFDIQGVVLAVRGQPVVGNEYAVNAQFDRVLTQKELNDLIMSARNNDPVT